MLGEEKSSISLFKTIPVLVINLDPKYVFIVLNRNGIIVSRIRTIAYEMREFVWEFVEKCHILKTLGSERLHYHTQYTFLYWTGLQM